MPTQTEVLEEQPIHAPTRCRSYVWISDPLGFGGNVTITTSATSQRGKGASADARSSRTR